MRLKKENHNSIRKEANFFGGVLLMKKTISVLLALLFVLTMFPFAVAAPTEDYSSLIFDPDATPAAILTTGGVTYNVYREFYCTDPIAALNEGIFMLTIRVPVSYNGYDFTEEELADAPIFYTNPWGGDNGSAAPAATQAASGTVLTALQKGWITVNVGMRGKSNVPYGKLPNPIADLKASVRYLHFNDDVMPGDANKIIVSGTSSGGCATVMLGASGNTTLYDVQLSEIGAYMGPGARDDIWLAAPSCAVAMRGNSDPAISWALFGDLTDAEVGVDASELNKVLSVEFIRYLEDEMELIAEYDVPGAGIEAGDPLTNDNYAAYMLPNVEKSIMYYLNNQMANAGDRTAIETYLAGSKNSVVRSSWLTAIFDDSDTLVGVDVTSWTDFWRYNSGITGNSTLNPLNTWSYQFDGPAFNTSTLEENGILPTGAGSPSTQSFGKPTDNGAIYSAIGIAWATANKGITISQEYLDLYEFQRNSVDPMYFLLNAEELGVTIAPNWVPRAGSADFVVPPPTFFALSTKLENMGYNVDTLLTWDQGHGATNDSVGVFAYIEGRLAAESAVDELVLSVPEYLVPQGGYANVTTFFNSPVCSNVAILDYTFDTEKFDFADFHVSDVAGLTLLSKEATATGARIQLMVMDYNMQGLGKLAIQAKSDAVLTGWAEVSAVVNYIVDVGGTKTAATISGSTRFTTAGGGGTEPGIPGDTNFDGVVDIIDLSNMVDWFGFTSDEAAWEDLYIFFDFNNDGEIGIYDIIYVAQLIA